MERDPTVIFDKQCVTQVEVKRTSKTKGNICFTLGLLGRTI